MVTPISPAVISDNNGTPYAPTYDDVYHSRAGAIAQAANVPPSTMSHHLGILERAGLVESERESRLIHYRADYEGMRRLLAFLMQDCCQGVPEMCADLFGELDCKA